MLARECRTVGELLDDSDGLAREALLDMSADRALGIVRGWPQLMQSAAEMWVVIPADPTVSSNGDRFAISAAMGRGVGRSVAAGHWLGRGLEHDGRAALSDAMQVQAVTTDIQQLSRKWIALRVAAVMIAS